MAARHRSRRRALQVLFEWDMRKHSIDQAISLYYGILASEEGIAEPEPDEFMEAVVRGVVAKAPEIDALIAARAQNWRLERIAVVDRNILRLAIYELMQQSVPAPIVIDEAIELARRFSSDESLSFINGILEAVHRETAASQS